MSMSKTVKELMVVILLAAILIPIAFAQFFTANTTGWDASTLAVWAVLPVIGIVVLVLKFLDKL